MNGLLPTGGAARGDTTRKALITTAIAIFGRDGFDAASTRAISKAAGVNQALISYHFGGKPGLYVAALQHIAENVRARIWPLLDGIEDELDGSARPPDDESSAERALQLLFSVTDAFAQVLTSDESSSWARLILREQQDPSEGFDVLYDGFMNRLFETTLRLVRLARRGRGGDRGLKILVVTILGQVLVFRAARTTVMRALGWRSLGPGQVKTIQATLRGNIAAMLATEQLP